MDTLYSKFVRNYNMYGLDNAVELLAVQLDDEHEAVALSYTFLEMHDEGCSTVAQ